MPLDQFCCSICAEKGIKVCAPKKYLEHGKFNERMRWLRKHYSEEHPREFKRRKK